MANFRKGPQVLLVNSSDRYKMYFYASITNGEAVGYNLIETGDIFTMPGALVSEGTTFAPDADGVQADPDGAGAGTAVALTDVGLVKIMSYVNLVKGAIKTVRGSKGIAAQTHKITATLSGGTFTVGNEVVFTVRMKSTRKPADLASWKSDYTLDRTYSVVITSAITTLTLLAAAITAQINARGQFGAGTEGYLDLTATSSGAVITIQAPDTSIELTTFVEDASTVFTVVNADVATFEFFEGRNTARQLKESSISIEADPRVSPYNDQIADVPINGKLYSHYSLTFDVARPDLGGGDSLNQTQSGEFTFDIYINEDLTSYIAAFVAWLNASGVVTGTKTMYTGTTYANRATTSSTLT